MSFRDAGLGALAATFLFGFGSAAIAALPPQYQRQRELAAIISDQAVLQKFGGKPIESIVYADHDRYEVKAGNCVLQVRIADDPQPTSAPRPPGPRHFHLVIGEPSCN